MGAIILHIMTMIKKKCYLRFDAADGGGPKEPAGFVNRAAVPLHVWVAGRSCEVLLTESSPIAAGGYRLFNAWRGQTFRARVLDSVVPEP